MSTPDYKWLMTLEHDGFDGTTYARVLRLLRTAAARKDPSCDGNDGPATIKLGSAPLTLRATVAKGYGQFTITIDCVRSTTEPTRTRQGTLHLSPLSA